jgi:hypothetical protein
MIDVFRFFAFCVVSTNLVCEMTHRERARSETRRKARVAIAIDLARVGRPSVGSSSRRERHEEEEEEEEEEESRNPASRSRDISPGSAYLARGTRAPGAR